MSELDDILKKYLFWSKIRSTLTFIGLVFAICAGAIFTLKLAQEQSVVKDAMIYCGIVAFIHLFPSYLINIYLLRVKKKNYGLSSKL